MPAPDILCLGNAVVDLIARPVDRLPDPGHLALLDTLEMHVGGNGPNCALAVARLGGRVGVAGLIGDDPPGRFLRARLDSEGVDTVHLTTDPGVPTSMSVVIVNSQGERSFLHQFGANASFTAAHVDLDRMRSVRFMHAGSHFILPAMDGEPLGRLLRDARSRGIRTSLDVCWDPSGGWMRGLAPCLSEADIFMPSENEAEMLTGEPQPESMATRLKDFGARAVIIKCGQRGCFARTDEWSGWVSSPTVDCIDSTGAGDCFAAGLLLALASGDSMRESLHFATACGALSVTGVGAAAGLLPRQELAAWLEQQGDGRAISRESR